MPPYGMAKNVDLPFQAAVDRITERLREEGFGVLATIDVQETLRQKLGLERGPYVILGACNPTLAREALDAEPDIGLLLPCNVVVYETEGKTRVAVLDPEEALGIVRNDRLQAVAKEAKERLARALAAV